DLSERQLAALREREAALLQAAADTYLQPLATRISADLEQQQKRLMASSSRADQLVSTAAPSFSLNLIDGSVIDSANLAGKTVVLHFWDYRDQPLSEPYGQTGYLDFLASRSGNQSIQVIGISTSPDFQSPELIGRARRSARKLREFMNLNYPIGYDDGSLLRTLGDPRDREGQLPLWVVLSPQGKIAHYHAGYYEIDARRGLHELETLIQSQQPQ
ncbi:MAG: TlpA family protein disulfide reductase, partial [Planctomycetaceae bacterium]|nr:TlpA family protein disulfide reductase [Planctomycetaceae bacterium]